MEVRVILSESKQFASEALRLFLELSSLGGDVLPSSSSSSSSTSNRPDFVMNSNTIRAKQGMIRTNMLQVLSKLQEIEVETMKWENQRECLEMITTENVAIKKAYLVEKRRTASLYLSLGDSIAAQQTQGIELRDQKVKLRSLQKDSRKMQRVQLEANMAIQKLNTQLLSSKKSKATSNGSSSSSSLGKVKSKNEAGEEHLQPVKKRAKVTHHKVTITAAAAAAATAASTTDEIGLSDGTSMRGNRESSSSSSSSSSSTAVPPPGHSLRRQVTGSGTAPPSGVENLPVMQPRSHNSSSSSNGSGSIVDDHSVHSTTGGGGGGRVVTTSSKDSDPHNMINKRVKKWFAKQSSYFEGTVVRWDKKKLWYRVEYDDGDVEEFDMKELKKILLTPG